MDEKIKMQIIGFSGKMGSGKNYVAERILKPMLNPQVPTLVCAFADQLKIDTIYQDQVAYERVYGEKDTESRQLLQRRGTENGRLVHGEDVWIRCMQAWIRAHSERGIKRFLITDVRFENEAEWIRSLGGMVIRVEAPERTKAAYEREKCSESAKVHASETALDAYANFDGVLQNDIDSGPQLLNVMRDLALMLDNMQMEHMLGKKWVVLMDLDDTICRCGEFYDEGVRQLKELLFQGKPTAEQSRTFADGVAKHVLSFEHRYYTRTDFVESLMNVARYCIGETGLSQLDIRASIQSLGDIVFNADYSFLHPHYPQLLKEYAKHPEIHLVIYTLGDRPDQMRKLCALGLSHLDVEIVPHKDANTLMAIRSKYTATLGRLQKRRFALFGDSVRRDIQPAIAADFDLVVWISSHDTRNDEYECFKFKQIPAIADLEPLLRVCAEKRVLFY